jgi:hypothetical protein
LPEQYLITPEDLETPAWRGIQKAIAGGIKLIQLRAPNGYDPKYRDLAVDAVGLCAGKAQLMIKGPFEWLGDFLPPVGTLPRRSCANTQRPVVRCRRRAGWRRPAITPKNWRWPKRWAWTS